MGDISMMSRKSVLVTGATGLLGRQVVKAFQTDDWTVVGTGFHRARPPTIRKVDLTDSTQMTNILDDVKPHVVVHCAANRYPDQCEADRVGSRVINVEACGRLAAYCQRHSILLIYISSDYVFSGRPGEAPYTTSSTPEPANFYGQTKLEGERVTLSTMTESGLGLVLRVPVLYGECIESRSESAINILADLVWKSQTKLHGDKTDDDDPIQVDDWAIRYPTNTEDVARVIEDLARRYLLDRTDERTTDRPHLLQFSSEEAYTKYGICRIMADILGVSIHGLIVPHRPRDEGEQEDDDVVVKRAYDCHLSTQALKDLGMDVHTQNFVHWWKRNLRAYRK